MGRGDETGHADKTGRGDETGHADKTGRGDETGHADKTGRGDETGHADKTGRGDETYRQWIKSDSVPGVTKRATVYTKNIDGRCWWWSVA